MIVSSDLRVAAEREARPLVGDALGRQIGVPGQAAEAVEIRLRQMIAGPVLVQPDVGDADEAAATTRDLHAALPALTRMSKSSASFHFGTRKTVCRAWPKYSCVICSSIACLVFSSAPNSGDAGSRTWKSMGPFLIWMITLSSNLPSSGTEVVVGGAGAVVLRIVPVHVMVVDEAAIEEQAAVRRERARHDVGGIGMGAPVGGRADAAFGIGLEDDAAEVGHGA